MRLNAEAARQFSTTSDLTVRGVLGCNKTNEIEED